MAQTKCKTIRHSNKVEEIKIRNSSMLGIAPLEDKINDQKRRADKQIKKIENTNEELQELKQEREEIEKEYKKIRREIIALLAATLIKTCIGDLTQKTEVSKSQDNVEIAIPKEAKY